MCMVMSEHHAAVDTAAVESETMKKPPLVDRALIVGGGLGGLAAAIQLRKIGIDAQVRQTDRELFLQRVLLGLQSIGTQSTNSLDIFEQSVGLSVKLCTIHWWKDGGHI